MERAEMPNSEGFCVVCKKAATLKCSSCHAVTYCGKQHQKDDWPQHKASCRSYKVKTNSAGDCFVVAARNIKEGDVVIDEVPLVIGPNYLKHVDNVCVGCHHNRLDVVQKCPSCYWPACSTKCPGLKDATRHGAECTVLSKIKSSAIHFMDVILPLRCLVLQNTDPKKWKVLQKMADRAVALSVSTSSNEVIDVIQESILKPLAKKAPGLLPDCSEDTLRRILSVIDVYGLNIEPPQYVEMFAVCAVTSLMEHSCMPNTRRLVNIPPVNTTGPTENQLRCRIVMRASRDIPKGESISTLFMDTWMCTWARQHSLASRRRICCRCRRCLDPTELGTHFGTLRCTTGSCSGWVLSRDPSKFNICDWKCQACGKIYDCLHVHKVMIVLKDEMKANRVREVQNAKNYEVMLKRLEEFLHPSHHYCILIKERLYGFYARSLMNGEGRKVSIAQLERAEELCREVLSFMVNPAIVTQISRTDECLLTLSAVTNEIARRKKASGEWDSARFEQAQRESQEMVAEAMRHSHSLLDEASTEERLPLGHLQNLAVSMMQRLGM